MPGSALYDFGDMVRTTTSFAAEDERDLAKVKLEIEMFKALAAGYLEESIDFLSPEEIGWLVFSGRLITFTIGLRFLTDFLEGRCLLQDPPGRPEPRPGPGAIRPGQVHGRAGKRRWIKWSETWSES